MAWGARNSFSHRSAWATSRRRSSTTTRRMRTSWASTCSSRRPRCWDSCSSPFSSKHSTSFCRSVSRRASTASRRASWPCGGDTPPTAPEAGGAAGGGRVVDRATTRAHRRRRRNSSQNDRLLVSYSSLTITKSRAPDSQRLDPQRCIYVRAHCPDTSLEGTNQTAACLLSSLARRRRGCQ